MAAFSTPNDKTLARRKARAGRSRWISKLLFLVFGIGLMLLVRLYPYSVANAVLWVQSHQRTDTSADPDLPQVRRMPQDKVTVNRAGKPPAPPSSSFNYLDAQSQADAIRSALERLNTGG